jgi:hypothetical protein
MLVIMSEGAGWWRGAAGSSGQTGSRTEDHPTMMMICSALRGSSLDGWPSGLRTSNRSADGAAPREGYDFTCAAFSRIDLCRLPDSRMSTSRLRSFPRRSIGEALPEAPTPFRQSPAGGFRQDCWPIRRTERIANDTTVQPLNIPTR